MKNGDGKTEKNGEESGRTTRRQVRIKKMPRN